MELPPRVCGVFFLKKTVYISNRDYKVYKSLGLSNNKTEYRNFQDDKHNITLFGCVYI